MSTIITISIIRIRENNQDQREINSNIPIFLYIKKLLSESFYMRRSDPVDSIVALIGFYPL